MKSIINTIAALVILSATCGLSSATASESDLLGTAWLAQEIAGRDTGDGARSTLEFAKSAQVGGMAACNRYFGPVSLEGDAISFGNLAATRMMCPDPEMEQEQRFLQALSASKRLSMSRDGQELLIYADGVEPVLRFSRIIDK